MADMTGFIDDVVTDFNQARLDVIKEAKPDIGLVVLSEKERDVFRARSGDTAAAYVETAGARGQQLLDALNAELAGN
jgi:threonine dehydrogenase-like Zn-dependent dehydrogenase